MESVVLTLKSFISEDGELRLTKDQTTSLMTVVEKLENTVFRYEKTLFEFGCVVDELKTFVKEILDARQ